MADLKNPGGAILEVEKLNIRFNTPVGEVHAVRDVSFTMGREKLAIVGESGSGKSQTGRAILGLTPGKVTADKLAFHGQSLLGLTPQQWRAVRGKRIAMVMQDPKYSLNPVMTIGDQLLEAARGIKEGAEARQHALGMLASVRIRDPERVYRAWPHELSRRHGPARHDRHDADGRAGAADRRRADLRARRHGAAAGAGDPRRPGEDARTWASSSSATTSTWCAPSATVCW